MWSWKRWIKPLAFGIYIALLCVALPFCIRELNRDGAPANVQAWFIGGIFVMAAIPISLFTILEHLTNYTKAYIQIYIIRILWMVPIYAINAWFALRYPNTAIYLDTLRECYEAYVIYNFMAYLLSYLRHEYPDLEFMIEQKTQVKHLFPICCLPPWPMGRTFIDRCRHGTLQYTVIRPIMTVVAFITQMTGVYGEGEFDFRKAFVYVSFVNNLSQMWAMYCLILFYKCAKEELAPMHPIAKFLIVKAVVFMSFWQSMLISILAATGVIQKIEAWKLYDVKSISLGIQDFAICIEMFLAAIGHHFAFSVKPYVNPGVQSRGCCRSCLSMWDVSDVRHDVVEHVRHVGLSVRAKLPRPPGFPRRSNINECESTPLLDASAINFSGGESESGVNSCVEEEDNFLGADALTPGPGQSSDPGIDTETQVLSQSMTNLLLASQSSAMLTPSMNVVATLQTLEDEAMADSENEDFDISLYSASLKEPRA